MQTKKNAELRKKCIILPVRHHSLSFQKLKNKLDELCLVGREPANFIVRSQCGNRIRKDLVYEQDYNRGRIESVKTSRGARGEH